MCVCVCVGGGGVSHGSACVRAACHSVCVCACVRACVRAYMHASVPVRACVCIGERERESENFIISMPENITNTQTIIRT